MFLIRERLYVQEWSIGTVTRLHRQTLEQRFPHDFRIEVQGHWANVEAVFCAYYENPVNHSTWLLLRQMAVFDERDGRVLSADLIDPSNAAALMVGPTCRTLLRVQTLSAVSCSDPMVYASPRCLVTLVQSMLSNLTMSTFVPRAQALCTDGYDLRFSMANSEKLEVGA